MKEGLSGEGEVSNHYEKEEGGRGGEGIIPQTQPLIPRQHLAEQCGEQGPGILLEGGGGEGETSNVITIEGPS